MVGSPLGLKPGQYSSFWINIASEGGESNGRFRQGQDTTLSKSLAAQFTLKNSSD